MATVTGLTAVRMLEIEAESIVDGQIDISGNLILIKHDGTTINAGPVVGPEGDAGPQGPAGTAGVSSIPGEVKAWPGTTLPNQGAYGKWVWADGAVYSEATYPIASGHINVAWKTAYGQSSPGAGNFRVPDLRGLILAGLDQMPGGSRANRMTRAVAITIAGKTGEETHVVTVSEMPSHNHSGSSGGAHTHSVTDPGHNHTLTDPGHFHSYHNALAGSAFGGSGGGGPNDETANTDSKTTGITVQNKVTGVTIQSATPSVTIASQGSGSAHENVQPTVFVPYIVRLDG